MRANREIVAVPALLIGMLIAAQGVLGLAAPDPFMELVRAFQAYPAIYAAAIIRVAFGLVLVMASRTSRAPQFLRGLGMLILAGGLLTPFFGSRIAEVILGWWSEGGHAVVRGWACASLALGLVIVYATAPRRQI